MARRVALVVGNSTYEDSGLARLAAPDADVLALAEVLRDPSVGAFHDVQSLVNESFARTRRAIARFFEGRRSDDLLLLYFSGHGIRDAYGLLHLAVRDTERELLSATAIESSFITGCMDRCMSKRLVLVLDCCHSGAFGYGAKSDAGATVGTAVAFEGNGRGRIVLTATDSTQYAWEGNTVVGVSQPSVFTRHLTIGLRSGAADLDGDGLVTIDELYDYVFDQVLNETNKQTPGKWAFGQQGELVIARNPTAGVSGAPPPLPRASQSVNDQPFQWFYPVRAFLSRHPFVISTGIAVTLVLSVLPKTLWWTTHQLPITPNPPPQQVQTGAGQRPGDAASIAVPDIKAPTEPAREAGPSESRPASSAPRNPSRSPGGAASGRPPRDRTSTTAPPTTVHVPSTGTPAAREPGSVAPTRPDEPRETTPPAGTATAPTPAPSLPAAGSPAPIKPSPDAQVKETLADYERAAEARDLDLLRNVWPAAPESLRRSFQNMKSQTVDLRACTAPAFDRDGATITCQERVSVVGLSGISPHPVTSATTFFLRRAGDAWQIAEIKRKTSR